ncbi:fimbrial protein [Klebsiella aerogenes]|uniref:fimbrial protein n=1 Tax=Klebsiella aerogenes TaxID=548 RepID=UPI0034D27ADC
MTQRTALCSARVLWLSLVTAVTLLPGMSLAAGKLNETPAATLQFDGTIISASCNVDNGSKSQNVSLGTFYTSDFPSKGTTTKAVPFDINLKGCTDNISGARVSFTGATAEGDSTLLALTGAGTSGVASGLGVELLDKDMKIIPVNTTTDKYPLMPGDNNTLTFNLRYKSTAATVMEGDAKATLFFDMQYQ